MIELYFFHEFPILRLNIVIIQSLFLHVIINTKKPEALLPALFVRIRDIPCKSTLHRTFWSIGIGNHGRPWACEREEPVFKKVSWKVGVYSHLSGCLIGHRRDSAARRVVSDTDTPKSSLDNCTTSAKGTVPNALSCKYVLVEGFADGTRSGVEFLDHSLNALTQAGLIQVNGKNVLAAVEFLKA